MNFLFGLLVIADECKNKIKCKFDCCPNFYYKCNNKGYCEFNEEFLYIASKKIVDLTQMAVAVIDYFFPIEKICYFVCNKSISEKDISKYIILLLYIAFITSSIIVFYGCFKHIFIPGLFIVIVYTICSFLLNFFGFWGFFFFLLLTAAIKSETEK